MFKLTGKSGSRSSGRASGSSRVSGSVFKGRIPTDVQVVQPPAFQSLDPRDRTRAAPKRRVDKVSKG